MTYVDGFVVPVPKKNVKAYARMAKAAGKVWIEHGALEFRECAGDDLNIKGVVTFIKAFKLKSSETTMFSWIVYKSKAHRDRVNAKVLKDPRITKMMANKESPFDMSRMVYGGFKVVVDE